MGRRHLRARRRKLQRSYHFVLLIVLSQTIVSTHPFAASMSTRNFHSPWSFRPARWLDQRDQAFAADDLAASKPFLIGSRACVGQRFVQIRQALIHRLTALFSLARLEMRTILAKLFYMYDIKLDESNCARNWHENSTAFLSWFKPELSVFISAASENLGALTVEG